MVGLKVQRIMKGITQERLAKDTNLTLRQIRSYEQGTRSPKIETLNLLAKYFGCTIDDLVGKSQKSNLD